MKELINQKDVLFVIPARSGSKGVKDKNLKICAGETLLRRAVKISLDTNYDSRVVVSTDSREYLSHVSDLKCGTDFLRPNYLSGDKVGDIEVMVHALHASENLYGERYRCLSMIQPTSPLRKKSHIIESIKAVLNDNWEASFTANKVDLKYHPLKSLALNSDGSSSFFLDKGADIISRQMLSSTYIRNGACYSINPKFLTIKKSFIGSHSKIIETESMISIDSVDEIKKCEEILLKREKIS